MKAAKLMLLKAFVRRFYFWREKFLEYNMRLIETLSSILRFDICKDYNYKECA